MTEGVTVSPYRIMPLPGYTPTIGRLVAMLSYVPRTTLAAVEGLTLAQLDHLHDERSNSIGALLAHIAASSGSISYSLSRDASPHVPRTRPGLLS